jgi:radical SAM protein with 4Fe4S-binding SPASM domain
MPDARQLVDTPGLIRDGNAAELAERLRIVERRIPLEGLIETTFRCNLRCTHCYLNQPAAARTAMVEELPLERLLRLIDELAEAGCLFLTFSGGEPLLRPDFAPLYRHAVRLGLVVSVFTNGTLLDEAAIALFDEWRPDYVEVTLYGMSAPTYERVTRVPGSHARCFAGVERLRAQGIAVRLKAMVMSVNVHEVEEMERFARQSGTPFRFDGQLNPRIDGAASHYRELQLAPEALLRLDAERPNRMGELSSAARDCRERVSSQPENSIYGCSAGRTTFAVDAKGRLLLCPLSRRNGYDLREGSFAQGWNQAVPALRDQAWRTASPCRRCSLMTLCDSCPGANELETGDAEVPVAVFCQITHRRAAALLGDRSGHRADASCCLRALTRQRSA